MKNWLLILCLFPFFSFANPKPILPESAIVKVLIAKDINGTLLEVKGHGKIFDVNKKKSIYTTNKQRLWLTLDDDSLRWGDTDLKSSQIAFVPNDSETSFLVDGIQYEGIIYILNVGGKMAIVNGVGIEDYLCSILHTYPHHATNAEALDALSIALRTKVVHNVQKFRKNLWHFDAIKEGFQGTGILSENAAIANSLKRTKSLILQPKQQIERLGFDVDISFAEQNNASDRKPKFIMSLANERAKHHQNADSILKILFPNAEIEKFDHKLMMEVETLLEQ